MSTPTGSAGGSNGKFCTVCHEDVSAKPRTKDAKGRYFCQPCYKKALARKHSQRDPVVKPPKVVHSGDIPRDMDDAAGGPINMLERLLADEAIAPAAHACPGCNRPMADGAVICTACGFNKQSGQRMHVQQVAAKEPSKFAPSGLAGMLANPLIVGVALLAVFGIMAGAGWGNVTGTAVYLGIVGLFGLSVSITVLVFAFREGIGTGLLTLCVPFYVLYFVYGVCDNQWVRVLFGVSFIAQAIGFGMNTAVQDQVRMFGPY